MKNNMKISSLLFSPFTDSVILLSEYYVDNGLSFSNTGALDIGVNYNPAVAAHIKILADCVLRNYIAEHQNNLPLVEQLANIYVYTNSHGSLGMERYMQELIQIHTEVPPNGESIMMQKTRAISPMMDTVLKTQPGLLCYFKRVHSMWRILYVD